MVYVSKQKPANFAPDNQLQNVLKRQGNGGHDSKYKSFSLT